MKEKCKAKTKKGNPCKMYAKDNGFCGRHQNYKIQDINWKLDDKIPKFHEGGVIPSNTIIASKGVIKQPKRKTTIIETKMKKEDYDKLTNLKKAKLNRLPKRKIQGVKADLIIEDDLLEDINMKDYLFEDVVGNPIEPKQKVTVNVVNPQKLTSKEIDEISKSVEEKMKVDFKRQFAEDPIGEMPKDITKIEIKKPSRWIKLHKFIDKLTRKWGCYRKGYHDKSYFNTCDECSKRLKTGDKYKSFNSGIILIYEKINKE